MHELAVTKNIFVIIIKHAKENNVKKVLTVNLKIGALSDLETEWIQHYFDYLSKGTTAEGAKLNVERIPVTFQCDSCLTTFKIDIRKVQEIECPECRGRNCSLVSGNEYYIENMEAE